nr:hypothetical protein [uncultured Undibacterium sp.]
MADTDFTQTGNDTGMKKEATLADLKGNIKWIGDNLGSGATATFIELSDECGKIAYVQPAELLPHFAFNRLSDYCKTRIMSGIAAQDAM